MKKFLLLLVLIACNITGNSQQQVLTGLYMFNPLSVNPAYAGSHDDFSAVLSYRNHWAGLKGAPVTMGFSMHAPIKNKHIGAGLSVLNDVIGSSKTTAVYGDFMYRLQTHADKEHWLAFGLRAGIDMYRNDYSELRVINGNDLHYITTIRNTRPNFGGGIYYYGKRHYIGVSVPNILNGHLGNKEIQQLKTPHLNIMGGVVLKLTETIDFKPNANIIITQNAPISGEINASFLFYNKLWMGVLYRMPKTGGLTLSMSVNNNFQIGYAYEHNFSQIQQFSIGTHELILLFDLGKASTHITPRYF